MNNTDIEAYKEILKTKLVEKRYYHSLCVADEAKRIALKYGADADKCYLAGLLHDITKNSPKEEHLQIFESFGIMLSVLEKNAEKLWHAISGAAYIEHILEIKDAAILDAVRYHTTGKADMSLITKILFLADFTSLDRDYEDVEVIRGLVDKSLNEAVIYALKYSIKELVEDSKPIHPDTLAAFNEALLKEGN